MVIFFVGVEISTVPPLAATPVTHTDRTGGSTEKMPPDHWCDSSSALVSCWWGWCCSLVYLTSHLSSIPAAPSLRYSGSFSARFHFFFRLTACLCVLWTFYLMMDTRALILHQIPISNTILDGYCNLKEYKRYKTNIKYDTGHLNSATEPRRRVVCSSNIMGLSFLLGNDSESVNGKQIPRKIFFSSEPAQ